MSILQFSTSTPYRSSPSMVDVDEAIKDREADVRREKARARKVSTSGRPVLATRYEDVQQTEFQF